MAFWKYTSYFMFSGLVSNIKGLFNLAEMSCYLACDSSTGPLLYGTLDSFIFSTSHFPLYLAIPSSVSSFFMLNNTHLGGRWSSNICFWLDVLHLLSYIIQVILNVNHTSSWPSWAWVKAVPRTSSKHRSFFYSMISNLCAPLVQPVPHLPSHLVPPCYSRDSSSGSMIITCCRNKRPGRLLPLQKDPQHI